MGMGISNMASFILVSIIVGPALKESGIPILVSNFFILYVTTATMFTPPYAPNAYIAGAIARANPFRVGFQAMRLGIVCFLVPFIIIFNPALLLVGEPGEVALAAVTAIVGVFALSIGIEGYLLSIMGWLQRVLFIVGGLVLVYPTILTDLIGLGILALAFLWHFKFSKKASGPVTSSLS
jgi:TRAP-type uncharacterized transport system fused permease subunit